MTEPVTTEAAPAAAPAAPAEAPPGLFEDVSTAPAEAIEPAAAAGPYDALAMPEGLELSAEAMDSVKAKFAEANLTPEQAQLMFDAHLEGLRATGDATARAGQDAWIATQKEWQRQVAADPEIGGAKQTETISQIRKGAETLLGTKAAQSMYDALNLTGAGSNPAIVKALFRAFSMHAPAKTVSGNPPSPPKLSAASRVYPDQGALGNSANG